MNEKFIVIAVSGILCAVRLCSGWESTLFPEANEGQQLAIAEFSCVIDPRSEKLNSRKEAIHFTHNEGVKASAVNWAERFTQSNQFDAGDRFLVIYLRDNVVAGNRSLPYRSWSARATTHMIENGKVVVTIDGTKKRIDLDEFIDRVMAWFSVTESKECSGWESTLFPEANERQQLAIVEFSCVIDPRSEKLNSRMEAIHFTHNEGVKAGAVNWAETYTRLNQFDAGDRFLFINLRYNIAGNRSLPFRSWSERPFTYMIENGKAVVTIDGTKKRIDLDEFIDRVMAWFSVTESKEECDVEDTTVPPKGILI